jgi:Zn-dependent alcohol dehydrogenase
MQKGFLMSCRRGMTVIVGLVSGKEKISFSLTEFIWSEKIADRLPDGLYPHESRRSSMVTLYKAGKLKTGRADTARYPLERINEAIEAVERGEPCGMS